MRYIRYILLLAAVFFLAPLAVLPRRAAGADEPAAPTPAATAQPAAAAPYRAVWVSYLEWQQVDFSTQAAFAADVEAMLDDIAGLGATVVLAQVRPFGDALYPSAYFPFSHICTGTQGQDPGFDPLAVMIAAAHARGLQLEAWINPYRLQAGQVPALCAESPARLHPEWVRYTDSGAVLDPSSTAVRQYIADGVEELCRSYPLDGIHFDDYFYPVQDPDFDAADYAASGTALRLDDWRRENVNALMELCHAAAQRYGVRFGAAPAGDPEQNYTLQYSDAARWLRRGTVDYLMPQLFGGRRMRRTAIPRTACPGWRPHGRRCPGRRGCSCMRGWGPTASARGTALTAAASGSAAMRWPTSWHCWRAAASRAWGCTVTPACLTTPTTPHWPRARPPPCAPRGNKARRVRF